MRFFCIICGSVALGAAVACAASSEDDSAPAPAADGGVTLPPDAALSNDAVADSGDAAPSSLLCSPAGWCLIQLPDQDLALTDIWPLADRAFAIGSSASIGIKFLEWNGVEWKYIDDDSQNEFPARVIPTNVWAPNEDEVYYALSTRRGALGPGKFGAVIYRGRRPVPPATAWSWKQDRLECDHLDHTQRVWGTNAKDVYVLSCRKIYRLNDTSVDTGGSDDAGAEAGTTSWIEDYVDDDPVNPLEFHGVTGTAPDDIWFVGGRGGPMGSGDNCSVIVRKTATGYQRVVDSVPGVQEHYGECFEKAGLPIITGTFPWGLHAPSRGIVVGTRAPRGSRSTPNDAVRITLTGDGGCSVATSNPAAGTILRSVWGSSEDDLWFIAGYVGGGAPLVFHGTNIWNDRSTYQVSTLALNGAPNTAGLGAIRGTSNTNLWLGGAGRAFHKTTP